MNIGDWVVVGVDPEAKWVEAETPVAFRGRELLLRPADDRGSYPDVSTRQLPGESYYSAATFVHRFLSVIVWKRGAYIRVVGHTGGAHRARIGGRMEAIDVRLTISPGYDFTDPPGPTNTEQDLALALYREGLWLNYDPYRFLAFFRILNITLKTAKDQKKWINQHVSQVGHPAQERIKQILTTHPDLGAYLYAAGRSAIAHAAVPPIVDPDVLDDTHRINLDRIVVKAFAELYMRKELGLCH